MHLKVKLLSPTAKMPEKAHDGDLCWDLFADETVQINKQETAIVPTNIALQLPEGYGAVICERSGLASKGVIIGAGQIDNGYRGPISIVVRYMSSVRDTMFQIAKGDKIAQIKLEKIVPAELIHIEEFDGETERGENGFGSTGV